MTSWMHVRDRMGHDTYTSWQSVRDRMGHDSYASWQSVLRDSMAALSQPEDDDPILFHGTNAVSAGWILREGFLPGPPQECHPISGEELGVVHWGHPAVAAGFAEKWMRSDNPPVMFAARASDIAASATGGLLEPDWYACMEEGCMRVWPEGIKDDGRSEYFPSAVRDSDDTEPSGWRQSLAWSGCVTARDGRLVQRMALLVPDTAWTDISRRQRASYALLDPMPWGQKYGSILPPGMMSSMNPRDTYDARLVDDSLDNLIRRFTVALPRH